MCVCVHASKVKVTPLHESLLQQVQIKRKKKSKFMCDKTTKSLTFGSFETGIKSTGGKKSTKVKAVIKVFPLTS